MRLLLVHSFLPVIITAHASVPLYDPHIQQPYGAVAAASASHTNVASNDVYNARVPLLSMALDSYSGEALVESDERPPISLPATKWTKRGDTATVDPVTLAKSNGNEGAANGLADTSVGGIGYAFGFAHALSGIGFLVAVCAFVCIESLLSYAITGNTLLDSVLTMTKNAH